MREQFQELFESLRMSWEQVLAFLPRLLVGLVVLLVGWFAVKLLRQGFVRLLRLLRVDVALERAGVEDFLLRGGVRVTGVTLAGQILFWGLLLIVVLASLNLMGLSQAADLIDRLLGFLPNVLVAVIVLIFGSILARFARGLVFTSLNNLGVRGAEGISVVSQWAILFFVVSLALNQLDIGGQILVSAFQLAFGGLCLALAIAFGLGGREWAAGVLERLSGHNSRGAGR
ncbi:MAG: hypothetical protein AB7I33_10845 [Gemmatimonadales bacterium]